MAAVSLHDVRKRYGKTDVIHGIDLDVSDGELIVIVGPSGCGKSTLLRMVAGLEVVTDGEIRIGDRVVNRVEPKDRDIAMVFQTYALYPHMSVFDNMAYGLKIAKLSKDEIQRRVDEAARLLELSGLLSRKPAALSGGQRQRVAMGRAIVRQPSVFLFDEPLSNLDALLRVQMRLEIKQLQRRLGITSLYVTHDQVEAMTLADRLVVMNAGVAEQIDSPMAVYAKPATRFVAGFIGSPGMNFIEGELHAGRLLLANGDVIVPREAPVHSGEVTAGVRPENLAFVEPQAADFSLQVVSVESLGAETLVHGVVAGRSMASQEGSDVIAGVAGRSLAVRAAGTLDVTEGDTVGLQVAPGGWHWFDNTSGRRIPEA